MRAVIEALSKFREAIAETEQFFFWSEDEPTAKQYMSELDSRLAGKIADLELMDALGTED